MMHWSNIHHSRHSSEFWSTIQYNRSCNCIIIHDANDINNNIHSAFVYLAYLSVRNPSYSELGLLKNDFTELIAFWWMCTTMFFDYNSLLFREKTVIPLTTYPAYEIRWTQSSIVPKNEASAASVLLCTFKSFEDIIRCTVAGILVH